MSGPEPSLLWVDIETTGLEPTKEFASILELGLITTDADLNEIARDSWVIHYGRETLGRIGDWALKQHMQSGLLFQAFESKVSIAKVERSAIDFCIVKVGSGVRVPLAGSSVHFDRAWLKFFMPTLEARMDYHNFDVSTVRQAAKLFRPETPPFTGRGVHRVLPDLQDSIGELRHYISHGIVVGPRIKLSDLAMARED
jgi:oligoribonuclease